MLTAVVLASAGCEAHVAAVAAFRTPSPDAVHSGAALERLPPVTTSDTLVSLGIEYPEPGPIGSYMYYQGWGYEVRAASIDLTDGTRNSLTINSALSIVTALRRAGYRARQGAFEQPPDLSGARFALLGRVVDLRVRSAGGSGAHRIDAETQVAWELFDLSSGGSVFGVRTYGRAQTRDSIAEAVLYAVDSALVGLLADFRFRIAVGRPRRSGPAAEVDIPANRNTAGDGGLISLDITSGHTLDTGDVAARVGSGMVTLRGAERFEESAFILTSDGLALTSLRAVGGETSVWVRFPSGVERRARVLRRNEVHRIALIRVPCPGECTTVPWTLERESARVPVVAVRSPAGFDPTPSLSQGETTGPAGRPLESRFVARLDIALQGGEPLARASDGTVFAVVIPWRSTMRGLALAEALRSLDVVTDAADQRQRSTTSLGTP